MESNEGIIGSADISNNTSRLQQNDIRGADLVIMTTGTKVRSNHADQFIRICYAIANISFSLL